MLNLDMFTGTEQYHSMGQLFNNAVVTDGVKYIMDNGYSWLVTDALSVIVCTKNAIVNKARLIQKLRSEQFLVIELILKKKRAIMQISDGNGKVLYKQKYGFTDADTEVKLYFTDNVMLLPSEW
jgi:hypothetical protein